MREYVVVCRRRRSGAEFDCRDIEDIGPKIASDPVVCEDTEFSTMSAIDSFGLV